MVEDMVLRSVYLRPTEDAQLRQLAHELNVTKSDLIRSAIGAKLRDWKAAGGAALVLEDLELGGRGDAAARATLAQASAPKPAAGKVDVKKSASHKQDRSTVRGTSARQKSATPAQREIEMAD